MPAAHGNRVLGNDIVDLDDSDTLDILENRPFLKRVFTDLERDRIAAAPPGEGRRIAWMFWSAKEAAYKALRAVRADLVWSPRAFVVRSYAPRAPGDGVHLVGELASAAGDRLRLDWECASDRVHAICTGGPDEGGLIVPVEADELVSAVAARPPEVDDSRAVRDLALRLYARTVGGPPPVIMAIAGEIPRFFLEDRELAIPLSLSHHGRFVAAAFLSPGG